MRIACWLPNATNKRPDYVIVIVFPVHQWLHEGTPLLRYTYSILPLFFYFVYVFTKTIDFFSAVSLNFVSQRSFSCLFECPLHFPFLLSVPLILGFHGRHSVRCIGFSGRTKHNKNLPTFSKMVQMLSAGCMNTGTSFSSKAINRTFTLPHTESH
jgi:hypothetical protein